MARRHSCLRPSSATCTRRLRTAACSKCRLGGATTRCPGRKPSGLGRSGHCRGAPQPLRPQWQHTVLPSACAKAAICAAPYAMLRLMPPSYKLHEEGKKLEDRLLEGRAPIWRQLDAAHASSLQLLRLGTRAPARLRPSAPFNPTPLHPLHPRHSHTDPLSTPPAPSRSHARALEPAAFHLPPHPAYTLHTPCRWTAAGSQGGERLPRATRPAAAARHPSLPERCGLRAWRVRRASPDRGLRARGTGPTTWCCRGTQMEDSAQESLDENAQRQEATVWGGSGGGGRRGNVGQVPRRTRSVVSRVRENVGAVHALLNTLY